MINLFKRSPTPTETAMDIQMRALAERDRYKAMLFDAWKGAKSQTKGMQRMARRIKKLRAEVRALKGLVAFNDAGVKLEKVIVKENGPHHTNGQSER